MGKTSRETKAAASTSFDMLGRSGQVTTRQGRGRVDSELHPMLKGRKGAKIYREMHDNNSSVGSAHEITEFILRRVRWDAKLPKQMAQDVEAQDEAEWLRSVFKDMVHTWANFVSDSLTMFPFGWAVFEKVYKIRRGRAFDRWASSRFNDNRIGLTGMFIRPQETLADWVFDDKGNAVAMIQKLPERDVTIPLAKCLHLVTKSNRNDPEGRSYYRNAVRSWEFLRRYEEDEAVGFNKSLQGMAIGFMPHDYFNSTLVTKTPGMQSTLDDVKKTMAGIRRNKYEHLLWPSRKNKDGTDSGWDLDQFKVADGRFTEIDRAITRKQREIHTVIFATQFLMLGQADAGGSRALGASQIDLYQAALEAILDNIEDALDEQVVQELYELNGVLPEKRARWTHAPVNKRDVEKWVKMLTSLAQSGIITPDDPLEDHVREEMELPDRDEGVSRTEDTEPDVGAELDPEDPNADPEEDPAVDPEADPGAVSKRRIGVDVFRPTEEMAEAASAALDAYLKLPRSRRKLNAVALSNARMIAAQAPITTMGVERVAAFFLHHKKPAKKSADWQQWQCMGGDAGRQWVEKLAPGIGAG